MLKFIILFSTFLSTLALAQVDTATPTPEVSDEVKVEMAISELGQYLMDKDAKCSPDSRLIKDTDIMQSYMKITLFKQASVDPIKCAKADKYLICLRNSKSKHLSDFLLKNKATVPVLMKKYVDVTESQIKEMLEFYNSMGKPAVKKTK